MRAAAAAAFFVFLALLGTVAPQPISWSGAATAQTIVEAPDYDLWEKVARRAEKALLDNRALDVAIESLRSELSQWRARFLDAQSINASRIATLKNQLAALGPAPESDGSEPVELTERRRSLQTQLADLQVPVKKAEEAYRRADGLISELDAFLRERQTARIFRISPSPALPANWPSAMAELGSTLTAVRAEVSTALGSDVGKLRLRQNLPVLIAYLVAAAVLLSRGRGWMERLSQRLQGSGPAAALRSFAASLGQVALPVAGLYALVQAIHASGLVGFRGRLFVDGILTAGIAFFLARWLVLRLAPKGQGPAGFLHLPSRAAAVIRRNAPVLGLLWGVDRLLEQVADFEGYSEAAMVVLRFPLLLLAGILLLRTGQVIRRHVKPVEADGIVQWTMRTRGLHFLGRALMLVGAAGPVAALIGYFAAGHMLVYSTILTIALMALLAVLSGVLRDLYSVIMGVDGEQAREALLPVLVSLVLVILATPLFALIWGARASDLTEVWTRFMEGFQIGDTRISPTSFLTFAIVFAIGYTVTRLLQSTLRASILPKTRIDAGGQSAIVSGVGYVGIFLAAILAITAAGIDLSSLAIVAGALSVGIGFGLQNIVSNFVSGIILLIERPIAEGDWIEVGDQMGTVREISVRSTRIETFDRYDVIIPNADLVSGTVINYTHTNLIGRAIIKVGVAYGSDTKQVASILQEIAAAHPMVLLKPPPAVHFVGFGADSLDFEIRALLRDVNFILTVKSDIHHEIARRFDEEGIEIPFAQRDIWLRNPETLRAARPGEDPTYSNRKDRGK